jgi:hypothetical protein
MTAPETTERERLRLFCTGSCEGFDKLRQSLAAHPELELLGASATVAEGAGALAGGHLDAVLHATRGGTLPADELAALRQHTRAPPTSCCSRSWSRTSCSRSGRPRTRVRVTRVPAPAGTARS